MLACSFLSDSSFKLQAEVHAQWQVFLAAYTFVLGDLGEELVFTRNLHVYFLSKKSKVLHSRTSTAGDLEVIERLKEDMDSDAAHQLSILDCSFCFGDNALSPALLVPCTLCKVCCTTKK